MAAELRTLVELSRTLGEPSRDLVILAEGNTSIRTEEDRMLVKAGGAQLGTWPSPRCWLPRAYGSCSGPVRWASLPKRPRPWARRPPPFAPT
jgi:hypothetical protein